MKRKLSVIFMLLSLLFVSTNALAFTAYIELDDSLNFNLLSGIDIFVNANDPKNSITLTPFNGQAIPVYRYMGMFEIPYVESIQTTYGVLIELIDKPSFLAGDLTAPDSMPFSPGLLASLTHNQPFSIVKIDLLAITPDGFYPDLFQVSSPQVYLDGVLYTISAVPVPSSLLLLSGGLFALVGITRRKK